MHESYVSIAKYRRPSLPRVLQRQRLLNLLKDNQHKNIWFVTGQAAQGKTTLISSWAERNTLPIAWLNVGAEDAPLENLFLSLVHSLSIALGRGPDHLLSEAGLGRMPVQDRAQVVFLARLLYENLPPGTSLVLDGLDRLPADASSQELLSALIENLPEEHRIIVLSREIQPYQQELTIKRRAFALGNRDLACTAQEVESLLLLLTGQAPGQNQLEAIYRLSEGWIGGVILCGQILRGMPELGQLDYFQLEVENKVKDEVFQYIARNLFQSETARVRDFLVRCAPLSVLEPSVLAELTGESKPQEILDQLCRRHHFISSSLDNEFGRVYRLHQLFSEFLQRLYREQLSPAEQRDYMLRAGQVMAGRGYWEEALRCYHEAGDHQAAASAIKRLAPELLDQGRLTDLERWIGKIPAPLVTGDPWLLYYQCRTLLWKDFGYVTRALPELKMEFARRKDDRGMLLSLALSLDGHHLALPWSVLEAGVKEAKCFLDQLGPALYPAERVGLLSNIALLYAVRGSAREAVWACEQAELIAAELDNPPLTLGLLIHYIDALNFTGDLQKAEDKGRQLIALSKQSPLGELPAEAFAPLSYLNLLQGNLDLARRYLDFGGEKIARKGLMYLLPVHIIYDTLWSALIGDHERAKICAAKYGAIPPETVTPFLRATSKELLAISHARRYEPQLAWDMADQAVTELDTDLCMAVQHLASSLMVKAMVGRDLGRRTSELEPFARRAHQLYADHGAIQLLHESELFLALLAHDQGLGSPEVKGWLLRAADRRRGKGYGYFMLLRAQEVAELIVLSLAMGAVSQARELMAIMAQRQEPDYRRAAEELLKHPDQRVVDLALECKRSVWRNRAPLLEINVLGGDSVKVGERVLGNGAWGRKQAKLLLMALAVLGPWGLPKERLMEAIWPDSDPESAERTFRVTLHRLRKALEPELNNDLGSSYVLLEGGRISLNRECCRLDVENFRDLLRQAAQARRDGDEEGLLELLGRAADSYAGPLLANEEYLEWCREPREKLTDEYADLLQELMRLQEEAWQVAQAMETAKRLIAAAPWREESYQRLMLIQQRSGRIGEALQTYQQCRRWLKEHMDAEPGWVTESIRQSITDQRD